MDKKKSTKPSNSAKSSNMYSDGKHSFTESEIDAAVMEYCLERPVFGIGQADDDYDDLLNRLYRLTSVEFIKQKLIETRKFLKIIKD